MHSNIGKKFFVFAPKIPLPHKNVAG